MAQITRTKLDTALKDSTNQEGIYVSGENNTKPFYTDDSVYEDKAYPLVGRRLSSSAGTVDYDWDEMAASFSPGGSISNINDLVGISAEYPHQAKTDGKIYPHIHWEQTSTDDVVFTLQYRVQDNNAAKTTAWTTMTASAVNDSAFTYTSGTLNQITRFKDGSNNYYIDFNGIGISATIQFKFTRTDSNTGDVLVTFFDFHYEIDDLGSREEFTK